MITFFKKVTTEATKPVKRCVQQYHELRTLTSQTQVLYRAASLDQYQSNNGVIAASCLPGYWANNHAEEAAKADAVRITSYTRCVVTVFTFSMGGIRPITIIDQTQIKGGIIPYESNNYPIHEMHVEVETSVIGDIPKRAIIASVSLFGGIKFNPDYEPGTNLGTVASCHTSADRLIQTIREDELRAAIECDAEVDTDDELTLSRLRSA